MIRVSMKYIFVCLVLFCASFSSYAQQNFSSSLLKLTENAISACNKNNRKKAETILEKSIKGYKSFSGDETLDLQVSRNILHSYLWVNKGVFKEDWLVAGLSNDTSILQPLYKFKSELEKEGCNYTNLHLMTLSVICNILRNNDQDLGVIELLQASLQGDGIANNVMLRTLYMNLGSSYYKIGNYNLAKLTFSYCKLLCESANDIKSPFYASCLHFLATTYNKTGEPLMAKLHVESAIEVYETSGSKVFECKDAYAVAFLNTYGECSMDLKDYAKAYDIFTALLNSDMLQNDKINIDIKAGILMNAAMLLFFTENYSDALQIMRQIDPAMLSMYLQSGFYSNLSLYEFLTDKEYFSDLDKYNEVTKNYLLSLYTQLSKKEREQIWKKQSESLNFYNYIVLQKQNSQAISNAYNNTLFTKNMLLQSSKVEDDIIEYSDNLNVVQLKIIREDIKNKLKNEKAMTIEEFAALSSSLVAIEKELFGNIPDFQEKIKKTFCKWEDVRSKLKENEIAIEFIEVPEVVDYLNGKSEDYVCALVVSSKSVCPEYVKLCASKYLNSYIEANYKKGEIDMLYSLSSNANNELFNMIWKPLLPIISNYKTIYYSTINSLNRINQRAIPYKNLSMGDYWNMNLVSSTANILNNNDLTINSAIVFGGVNYGGDEDELRESASVYQKNHNNEMVFRGSNSTRAGWKYLPGTKAEAEGIKEVLTAHTIKCELFEGFKANEEAMKSIDGDSPSIIHIATHGFYLKNNEDKQQRAFISNGALSSSSEDNSMKCSGLVFAGGNTTWKKGKGFDGIEDGILTADEISKLNLKNTSLVVLSACETALGDGNNVDGVFGLQRAFKKAGVQSIIMTLWEVDDIATKELMIAFYDNLVKGESKRTSFNKAVDQIKAKYKSPEYWAGFVMLD